MPCAAGTMPSSQANVLGGHPTIAAPQATVGRDEASMAARDATMLAAEACLGAGWPSMDPVHAKKGMAGIALAGVRVHRRRPVMANTPREGPTDTSGRPKPMAPGDQAPPGTPGTGEDVCPRCGGSGRLGASA